MFKLVFIYSLKPKVDPDEAHRVWREKHTVWVKKNLLPGARKYTINRVVHGFGPVDIYGYSMIWFEDMDSAVKAAERLRNAPPDEFLTKFVETPKLVVVEEEKVEL